MMLVPTRPPMTEGISSNRVLVVDDDCDFADSMAEILESHGYRTATAYSGAAALQEMESFDPHVALIDMRLGAERGTELIERMRAQRPDLVCILMTAYAELDSAVQALRNRADDYLLKPLDPSSVLGVIRDAMSRVRELTLAERRERLASVGSLAAGVAHDLNNVLTIVLHETELIERQIRGQDDAVRTGLRSIRASTLRAAEITRNLLLIARGDPTSTPCHRPLEVLEDLTATLQRSLPKGAALHAELQIEGELSLTIGSGQLYQVILNLLVNARDAIGEHGSITVRCRVAQPPAARSTRRSSAPPAMDGLLVSVTDDGPGIDPHTMQHLFEPFFTTKLGGSGLGLVTAYGLVRAAGGEMFVESTLGVGAEFSVWLPRATDMRPVRASDIVLSEPPQRTPSAAPSSERKSILLCDDDTMILQALTRMLRDIGYDVTHARGMNEAWQTWLGSERRFAVVITDVRLGSDRGTELVRRVIADRPDTHVILMSGDFQNIDTLDPVWPRTSHLQKPFSRAALCAALSGRDRDPD
jgi:signal transduction histidine kinase